MIMNYDHAMNENNADNIKKRIEKKYDKVSEE